jgi:hypothetical protein
MMLAADLQYWANVSQIVGAVGVVAAFAALVVAWVQLRKTRNATRGQMLLAVDQALAPYDDIRNEARNPGWQPPPNRDAGVDPVSWTLERLGRKARYPAGYPPRSAGGADHPSRFPVAFRPPAFASRSSDARRGIPPSSRSAYRSR